MRTGSLILLIVAVLISCLMNLSCTQPENDNVDPGQPSEKIDNQENEEVPKTTGNNDYERVKPENGDPSKTADHGEDNSSETEISDSFSAALMIELSLEDLTALADHILFGTIIDSESSWNEERTAIFTFHTISVEDYIKGCGRNNLAIKVPGGKAEGLEQWVEDAATFRKGEDVIVFLNYNSDDTYSVVGGFQGKLIVKDGIVSGYHLELSEFINVITSLKNN